jgi:RNA-directed DNA polymerase
MLKVKTDIDPDSIESWSQVDWKYVNQSVTKLRRRIFDAKRCKDFRRLVRLQALMLYSTANILYSIRKVSYNSGRVTPGIDGETLSSPKDRLRLFNQILINKWNGVNPKPIRRIYIKETTKLRPIGIPTVYDRVIQTMICNSLEPEWEAVFEKGSYGFRPKRNTNDAVSRVWLALNKPGSRKWIVDSDISRCFDSISHKYLLDSLKGFPGKNLIKDILESGIIIRDVWLASDDEGTPQGSPLSPLLCNIALHGLESELGVKYTKKGYVDQKGRLLIRFADDLVIICQTHMDAFQALEDLKSSLRIRGLQISELKTKVVHISEGFDFLGFNFKMFPKKHESFQAIKKMDEFNYVIDHNKVGIYVSPTRKSITKVKTKLKEALLSTKGATAEKFIGKINLIIRGYVQSKLHWHSNRAFREIDLYVYRLCWRWAIRKHPSKGPNWIKNKYFKFIKIGYINNKWVFTTNSSKHFKPLNPNNPFINDITNPLVPRQIFVYKTYWFKIRDYLVGKMDKLPDNRHDVDYFKGLETRRLVSRPFNIFRRIDKDIAISQEGICPICEMDLFNGEKIHLHHITPRNFGGKTTFSNLVYLHTLCHYKIHSTKDLFNYYFYILQEYKNCHTKPNYYKLSSGEEALPLNQKLQILF